MWEAISNMLTSSNAVSILLFLGVCIIGAFVLIKTNMLQIHTQSVRIGAIDVERNIIRQQLDFVRHHLLALESNLKKPEDYNDYLGKYIVEVIFDEYVNWITFNHINKSPAYVELKQDRIICILRQFTIKEEFQTEEFENLIREDTKKTIEALIRIREVYK